VTDARWAAPVDSQAKALSYSLPFVPRGSDERFPRSALGALRDALHRARARSGFFPSGHCNKCHTRVRPACL